MDIHKNARSCPWSRALLNERVDRDGWSVVVAARAAGMSRRRSSEWVRRGRAGEPMNDRSSAPARTRKTDPAKRQAIIELRRQRMEMRRIAASVGVSLATVARICGKAGLSRLSSIDPPPVVVRYERAKAGELLHIDIKKLGRIGRVGHRITKDRTIRARHVGWDFVHVAIDDASRVGYVEILGNERAETAAGFLRRAVKWFADQQVRIERVMSDNGVAYRAHQFAAGDQAQTHSTLQATDEWESGAIHPNPAARMGLSLRLRLFRREACVTGSLPALLQLPSSSYCIGWPTADYSSGWEQRHETRQLGLQAGPGTSPWPPA